MSTIQELCSLKSKMMRTQHERSYKNKNLYDRVTYFLDYNIEDSDVSDSIKFKVDKCKLCDILDVMKTEGVDISSPLDNEDEIQSLPLSTTGFDKLFMWYHDRLDYFVLRLREHVNEDYKYYTFVGITYDQMLGILGEGFASGIIIDITHPCWLF